MAERNHVMKVKTASGYDTLYPKTTAAQVITDGNNRFVTDSEKSRISAMPESGTSEMPNVFKEGTKKYRGGFSVVGGLLRFTYEEVPV